MNSLGPIAMSMDGLVSETILFGPTWILLSGWIVQCDVFAYDQAM